ncbi:MAG TPA: DUF4864 domain-containing protein [Alphaproteobacteria bacterium]|nr:DUF4864 domain-containing protein [Alphaproteobacteria bacterium]
MRRLLLVLVLLFSAPFAALAEAPVGPDDRQAIERVIRDQLAAFGRNDGKAAFGHASSAIQGMFRTPDNFMRMVREGYPAIYHSRTAQFLLPQPGESGLGEPRIVQPVLVEGTDGQGVVALYYMQRLPDGTWRIDGCSLAEGQSA